MMKHSSVVSASITVYAAEIKYKLKDGLDLKIIPFNLGK